MTGPTWYQILLACLFVAAGCTLAAFSFWYGARQRNWLLHVVGAGCALFVVGLVGERTVVAGTGRPASVWDLSIRVPLVPLKLDALSVAGIVVTLLGVSVVLFLERGGPAERWRPPAQGPLDEDDTV